MPECPQCHTQIPADAPQGVCPKCLVQCGLGEGKETQAVQSLVLPPIRDLAQAFPGLEVLELRGQGGMGAVYKARQKTLDRIVALKVLPMSVGEDPTFAERFTREARAMARLNHPNVVMVFDFGQANGLFYFVMEYVDGVNLREAIATERCDNQQALAIITQICDALQYAHDEGIVHRDIKPENVLLDKNGRVKIADFGLAKLLDAGAGANFTLTGTKQVVGTMHYMAPEQLERPTEVDHRADLYSLGVVFYELLTGELPLGRFAPPSEKSRGDADLDEVVLRTLEKEPDRRYQQASEIKTAVQEMPADHGVPPAVRRKERRRGISVPFCVPDLKGGILRANGIARLVGNTVTIEFDVVDQVVGWYRRPVRTIQVNVADLLDVDYRERFSTTFVTLRSDFLATFDAFPKNDKGRITLQVAKEDRENARKLVDQLRALLGQDPIPHSDKRWDEVSEFGHEELEPARESLKAPTTCLFFTGLINLIAVAVCGVILFANDFRPRSFDFPWPLLVIGLPIGILGIVAAGRLSRLESQSFGTKVCIAAALPIHVGFLLGAVAGIWTLIVMKRPLVRQAFRWREDQGHLDADIPPEKVLPDQLAETDIRIPQNQSAVASPRRPRFRPWRLFFKLLLPLAALGTVAAGVGGYFFYEANWKVASQLFLTVDGERKEDDAVIRQVLASRLGSSNVRVDLVALKGPTKTRYRVTTFGRERISSRDIRWRLSQRGQIVLGALAHPKVHKDIAALAGKESDTQLVEVAKDGVLVARWVPAPVGISEDNVVQRRVGDVRQALLLVNEYDLTSDEVRRASVVRFSSKPKLVLQFNVNGSRKLRMMKAAKEESDRQDQTFLGLVVDGQLAFTPEFTERMFRGRRQLLAVGIAADDFQTSELENWAAVLENPLATKLTLKQFAVSP